MDTSKSNCMNCKSKILVTDFKIEGHYYPKISSSSDNILLPWKISGTEDINNIKLCLTCTQLLTDYFHSRTKLLKLSHPKSKINLILNSKNSKSPAQLPEIENLKQECIAPTDNKQINSHSSDQLNFPVKEENITPDINSNGETILPDTDNDYKTWNSSYGDDLAIGGFANSNSDITEYKEQHVKLQIENLSTETICKLSNRLYNETVSSILSNDHNKCSVCKRQFSDSQQLANHEVSSHNPIKFNINCSFCPQKFSMVWFLRNHLKACHNGVEIVRFCQMCQKKFYSEMDLENHLLKDHDIRKHPFKCRNCPDSFKVVNDLRFHLVTTHKDTKEAAAADGNIKAAAERKLKDTTCNHCGQIFASSTLLNQHIISEHDREEKSRCEICNEEFKSYKQLLTHRNTHTSCLQCNKQFRVYKNLHRHHIVAHVHTPHVHRPFACEICGQRYAMHGQLDNHYRWHVEKFGPKIFCNICGKGYELKGHFMQHMRQSHSENGRETFKCPFCDQVFTARGNLGTHLGEKHSEKLTVPCNLCGKKFLNAEGVSGHKRVHTQATSYEAKLKLTKDAQLKLGKITINGKLEIMACYSEETFLFTCPRCGKSCDSKTHFLRHLRMVHSLKGYTDPNITISSTIDCPICEKSFARKDLMDKHRRRAHGINNKTPAVALMPKSFDCPHCKRTLTNCAYNVFMAHVNRHEICIIENAKKDPDVKKELNDYFNEEKMVFECTLCNKSFEKRPGFLSHFTPRLHPNLKIIYDNDKKDKVQFPFKCPDCPDMAYPTIELLRRHKEAHSYRKDRVRQCPICNIPLKNLKYLNIHLKLAHK